MQFLAANAFTLVGGVFAIAFMIVIFIIFVKALRGTNLGDLFQGEVKQEMSITKFWTNVAYFCATIAFLSMNLISNIDGETLIFVWMIYLGTVGTSAVASKWLALRYGETLMKSVEFNTRTTQVGQEIVMDQPESPDTSGHDDDLMARTARPRVPNRTARNSGSSTR